MERLTGIFALAVDGNLPNGEGNFFLLKRNKIPLQVPDLTATEKSAELENVE